MKTRFFFHYVHKKNNILGNNFYLVFFSSFFSVNRKPNAKQIQRQNNDHWEPEQRVKDVWNGEWWVLLPNRVKPLEMRLRIYFRDGIHFISYSSRIYFITVRDFVLSFTFFPAEYRLMVSRRIKLISSKNIFNWRSMSVMKSKEKSINLMSYYLFTLKG